MTRPQKLTLAAALLVGMPIWLPVLVLALSAATAVAIIALLVFDHFNTQP